MKQGNKNFSKEEMEEFLKEKETIKQIVGQIGGQPTTFSKVFNIAMMILILGTLISAPFIPKNLELPAVEVGLVVLSIKIFYLVHNEAKVIHFQFWMLSSLEWRMNDTAKRLARLDEDIHTIAEELRKKKK